MPKYDRPGRLTNNLLNPVVAAFIRLGVSVWGSCVLAVRGRTSGVWRTMPVNLLGWDGARYLVWPRGQTPWVRNLRAAGGGELRVGRRVEPFQAVELPDGDKPPVLRAYLRRWQFEVGAFFEGVGAGAPDGELKRIAPEHPVFWLRG